MSALVLDEGYIYFPSSITGDRRLFFDDPVSPDDPIELFSKFRDMFRACQDGIRNVHNYYGSCGELNALELYISRDYHGEWNVANGWTKDVKGQIYACSAANKEVRNPCDINEFVNSNKYGCRKFRTEWFPKLRVVGSGTPDNSDQSAITKLYTIVKRDWRTHHIQLRVCSIRCS